MRGGFNKNIMYFVILCLMTMPLTGCGKKARTSVRGVIPVKVMKVKNQDIDIALEYVGNIKAQAEALVYPKISGKVSEKLKDDGVSVSKGDALVIVDRDEVGFKFEPAPVESPMDGVVGRLAVDIGTNVTPQTAVALVVDMEKVKIAFDIPEKYIPKVFMDQKARVTVDAYPDEEFTGKVTKISPVIDVGTRSAPVDITIDNQDHRLKSGMFAKVKLVVEKHEGVPVILREAVIGRDSTRYVYIVEENKAVLRQIRVGQRQGPDIEVLEGLEEGDAVVIMGQQRLQDGDSVEAEE